ncbi:protein S100-B [Oxyura jamaicensis]|nr:protein S100-B [Oxyura jamaicensis]
MKAAAPEMLPSWLCCCSAVFFFVCLFVFFLTTVTFSAAAPTASCCAPAASQSLTVCISAQCGSAARDTPVLSYHWCQGRCGTARGSPPPGIRSQQVPGPRLCSWASLSCSSAVSREDCTVTMSELEKAMIAVIDAFHQYSGKEGDKHKLKKSELKELINNELTHFLGEIKDQETVDKVMEALDSNGDAECDFQEFVAFIAMVTAACHEFFEHE